VQKTIGAVAGAVDSYFTWSLLFYSIYVVQFFLGFDHLLSHVL
jgi:hypothetical protein